MLAIVASYSIEFNLKSIIGIIEYIGIRQVLPVMIITANIYLDFIKYDLINVIQSIIIMPCSSVCLNCFYLVEERLRPSYLLITDQQHSLTVLVSVGSSQQHSYNMWHQRGWVVGSYIWILLSAKRLPRWTPTGQLLPNIYCFYIS